MISTLAVSGPNSEGLKVTVTTHFWPGAREVQVLVCVKSRRFVPYIAILEIVRVELPLFTTDIGSEIVVPIVVEGYVQQGLPR